MQYFNPLHKTRLPINSLLKYLFSVKTSITSYKLTAIKIITFTHVKIICLLLSVYVLLLSARPCCADDACSSKSLNVKEPASKTSLPEKECAGCSPFFSCGSCAGFVIGKPVMNPVLFVVLIPVKHYGAYKQPYIKEIALTIWQPPKLS